MNDSVEARELLYEGKAKKLFATADPDQLLQFFKDDATAFNAKKRGTIEDKGIINNRMSELFFGLLEKNGVKKKTVKEQRKHDARCPGPQKSPQPLVAGGGYRAGSRLYAGRLLAL